MNFVSFDLAKKLKEKGFSCQCPIAMYNERGDFHVLYSSVGIENYYDYDNFDEHDCVCPTISHVLKWLREEKKIWICVNPVESGFETTIYDSVKQYYNGEYGGWMYYNNLVTTLHFGLNYEDSVIDGIKYVLDNLI